MSTLTKWRGFISPVTIFIIFSILFTFVLITVGIFYDWLYLFPSSALTSGLVLRYFAMKQKAIVQNKKGSKSGASWNDAPCHHRRRWKRMKKLLMWLGVLILYPVGILCLGTAGTVIIWRINNSWHIPTDVSTELIIVLLILGFLLIAISFFLLKKLYQQRQKINESNMLRKEDCEDAKSRWFIHGSLFSLCISACQDSVPNPGRMKGKRVSPLTSWTISIPIAIIAAIFGFAVLSIGLLNWNMDYKFLIFLGLALFIPAVAKYFRMKSHWKRG